MSLGFIQPVRASTAAVNDLESSLGFRLPGGLRETLLTVSNGGEIEPTGPASMPAVGINALFGVNRDDDLDLVRRMAEYKAAGLPTAFVPFADADGGNLVCFSTRVEGFGTIWFWDHELPVDSGAFTLVAESFEALVEDLAPVDDADLPTVTETWVDPSFLAELEGD